MKGGDEFSKLNMCSTNRPKILLRRSKLKGKKLLSLVGSICLILVLAALLLPACAPAEEAPEAAAPAAAEVYKWRMVSMGTAVSPWHTTEFYFVEAVETMSGGRIDIELYPKGELFDVTDSIYNVSEGVVELAATAGDYAKGFDTRFSNLSYLCGSPLDDVSKFDIMIYRTGYAEAVNDLYEEHNCHWLGVSYGSPEQMLVTVPIRTLEDFKGLKLRGSGPSELMFNKLGASATYIDFGEIYTAIQLGTIVGGDMTTPQGNWDMGFHEVTNYIIEPMLYTRGFTMDHYINLDVWNEITPDLQEMLVVACRAGGLDAFTEEKGADLEYRQKMIDYGLEVITLSPEDVTEAFALAQEIWDELAAQDPMSAIRVRCERETARLLGIPGF